MDPAVNRRAQAVLLLLIGGAVLRASLTDLHLRYVKAGLQPFLVAAGVLLVVAALMTLWYDLGVPPATDRGGSDHADHDGHGHGPGGPRIAWLLLLPVFGLLLISPPALGAYTAGRTGTALTGTSSDFEPLPDRDPVRITILDYASRAVFDDGNTLTGRRVELTGFAMPAKPDGWYLTRMVVSCCAADARPIKVALTGAVPSGLAADGWLRVIGRYDPAKVTDPVNGGQIPALAVDAVTPIGPPAEQYE